MPRYFAARWLALGFITFASATLASAQTTAAKIAIANPARIFAQLQETNDLKGQMEQQRKTVESTDLEKRTALRDLKAQRDQLKPDSPTFGDLNKKLMQASVDYEVWTKITQADTERSQKQQIKSLFDKIAAATAAVAANKQIDLVLAEQKPDYPQDLDQINLQQLQLLLSQRNVLFAAKNVDISDEVVTQMDAKYKSGK